MALPDLRPAIKEAVIRLLYRGAVPYRGPTYELGKAKVPVYQAGLPRGAAAVKPAWLEAVISDPRYPLTPQTAAHELVHVRQAQREGVLEPLRWSYEYLSSLLRRKDPYMDMPREREAYAAEDAVKELVPPSVPAQMREFFLNQARSSAMGNR